MLSLAHFFLPFASSSSLWISLTFPILSASFTPPVAKYLFNTNGISLGFFSTWLPLCVSYFVYLFPIITRFFQYVPSFCCVSFASWNLFLYMPFLIISLDYLLFLFSYTYLQCICFWIFLYHTWVSLKYRLWIPANKSPVFHLPYKLYLCLWVTIFLFITNIIQFFTAHVYSHGWNKTHHAQHAD